MSVISQFFPSPGSGGGSSSKMDLEVLIVSGGGGAAITNKNSLCYFRSSGLGGGGAAFVGSVPVAPGSTVPVVVGAGGAGSPSPQPDTTNQNGARGGCSSITTPEGTICVAGGGGGVCGVACAIGYQNPANSPPAGHVYNGGTGGTGGCNRYGPYPIEPHSLARSNINTNLIVDGGRPYYSSGQFEQCRLYTDICPTCTTLDKNQTHVNNFRGPGQLNHKYGTFMGGAAAGGLSETWTSPNPNGCVSCYYNGHASGGAGGHGMTVENSGNCCSGPGQLCVYIAGSAYCSDITGTLEGYGQGVVHLAQSFFGDLGNGGANTGRGGSVAASCCGCICSGSGGSGVVVIRYPDQFAAAPASPGATDCSPATPGYYTYRFNSTGSITLP